MQVKVVHLVLLVFAGSIVFAIVHNFWGPAYRNANIVFGGALVLLVAASIGSCFAQPRWRRLWLGYAAFGWCWLILVLRHYLGLIPDVYAPNKMDLSLIGVGFSLVCGLVSQYLPGMREV